MYIQLDIKFHGPLGIQSSYWELCSQVGWKFKKNINYQHSVEYSDSEYAIQFYTSFAEM